MAPDTDNKTADKLQDLEQSLVAACQSVTSASGALKECFVSAETSSEQFQEIRNRFTNQAIVFKDVHLELSRKVINDIMELFDHFKLLPFEALIREEVLNGIVQKLDRYGRRAEALAQLYKAYQVEIIDTEADATQAVETLKLDEEFSARRAERAERKSRSVSGLVAAGGVLIGAAIFAPALIGFAAGGATALGVAAEDKRTRNLAKFVAAQGEKRNAEVAGKLISDQLLPAIKSFLEAVNVYHTFFRHLETRLRRHNVSLSSRGTLTLEILTLKEGADSLLKECRMFLSAASQASTELEWVQEEARKRSLVDGSYVERWLRAKLQELEMEVTDVRELCSLRSGGSAGLPATLPPGRAQ